MLILLLLFALFHLLQGAPLSPGSEPLTGVDASPLAPRDTADKFGQRGTNDIIVSCLATIFASTWTVVHPNIPSPTDSGWVGFKRRMLVVLSALLAPESTTGWALNQFLGAKRIVAEYNSTIAKANPPKRTFRRTIKEWFNGPSLPLPSEQGINGVIPWSMRHAFFIQMGGFMLSDNGKPIQTLVWPNLFYPTNIDICQYISNGSIDAPRITEAEIKDRSKGDAISKGLVVLQTSWFIAQCIARWAADLPVTELEVVTLAFAVLNAITYGLWWEKPQDVGLPVYLELKRPTEKDVLPASAEIGTKPIAEGAVPGSSAPSPTNNADVEMEKTQIEAKSEASVPESSFQSRIRKDRKHHHSLLWIIWRIPYRLVQVPFRAFGRLISWVKQELDDVSSYQVREGDLRVSIFYATTYSMDVLKLGVVASGAISGFFGFIYLLPGWFLDFPSRAEMIIWRGCAIIITAQPILMAGSMLLLVKSQSDSASESISILAGIFGFVSTIVGIPLYVIARLVLLILAFISLRALPSGALQTINWVSFIPHL